MRFKSLAALVVGPVLFLMAVGPASAVANVVTIYSLNQGEEVVPVPAETRLEIPRMTMEYDAIWGGTGNCLDVSISTELSKNSADPLTINGSSENSTKCWTLGGWHPVRNLGIPGQIKLYSDGTGTMPFSFEIEYWGTYCQFGATVPLEYNAENADLLPQPFAMDLLKGPEGECGPFRRPGEVDLDLDPLTLEDETPLGILFE